MSILDKLMSRFTKPISLDIAELKVKIFEEKYWHYNKSVINFSTTDTAISIASEVDQISYVNFLEANNSFSAIEEKQNKLIINQHNSLLFKGQATEGLSYIIYLIEYDENNQQIKKHHFKLNQMKSFTAQANTKAARLAIRISGKGKLLINGIFISPFLPVKYVKKEKVADLETITVTGILSDISIQGLTDFIQVNPLSAAAWENEITKLTPPDCILIDAKEVLHSDWSNGMNLSSDLGRLFLWCETSSIPIILWHKQSDVDPAIFEPFIPKFQFVYTHSPQHYDFYKTRTDSGVTQLTPYPIRPLSMEKLPTKRIVYLKEGENFSESSINTEYQMLSELTADQILEKASEGYVIYCQSSLASNKNWSDFIIPFTGEAALKSVMEWQSTFNKLKEMNRRILWSHNFKDFIRFLLKQLEIEYRSKLPTMTMYVTIHSSEEYRKAAATIEKQTVKNVKWILLIMPFDGYEEVINQCMQVGEIHIHSYALKHRFIRNMVSTTHFGIYRSKQIQDEFFIEDAISQLEYENVKKLDVLDEQQQITGQFYLTEQFVNKPLKQFVPVTASSDKETQPL